MPLAPGQSLSFYEILGPLGAGAMGEVYRARDTRLDREVAIKVLPEHFADDEERLKRFEREAKSLASLNHPNVAGIHGIDQVDGTCFIAMELVPGEDLSQRLEQGALPLDEAIDVCRQIAEGLEVAHEAGVIHRDLKPANVRVTPQGVVKLLDFGLAKPIRPQGSPASGSSAESDSFLVTSEGMVLGTPTYMSPEQARGKLVDRRTDIWAFGCVLYECLSGRRAFAGDAFGDLVASILTAEVDLGALPSGTPLRVRELITRCLIKDPRRRLRDVGDARIELECTLAGDFGDGLSAPLEAASPPGKRQLAWGLAALALAALAFALGQGSDKEESDLASLAPATPGEVRFPVELPPNTELLNLAVSADGSTLALVLEDLSEDISTVYIRRLDQTSLRRLPEADGVWTDGGGAVALSPNGDALAFVKGTQLYTLDIKTRVKTPLASCGNTRGAPSWGSNDEILFTGNISEPLSQISAWGGFSRFVSEPNEDRGEVYHSSPTWLADGTGFLANVHYSTPREDGAPSRGQRLVLFRPDEEPTPLCSSDSAGWLAGDQLIWRNGSRLLAQTFDARAGVLSGTARVVADGLGVIGSRPAAASHSGVVAYQAGHPGETGTTIGWVNISGGKADSADVETVGWTARNIDPVPSPIDDRVAVIIFDPESGNDLWIFGPDQAPRQITHGEGIRFPIWSPDGNKILYSSRSRSEGRSANRTFIRASDGSGEREEFSEAVSWVFGWSPDGAWLAYAVEDGTIRFRWVGDDTGAGAAGSPDTEDRELRDSKGKLSIALRFSPDGNWIAYQEGLGDNAEVFVRPFIKGLGARQSVSNGQGRFPDWSPTAPATAPEILYSRGNQSVMRVTLKPADAEGTSLKPGQPEELFRMRHRVWNRGCMYSHDGKRILVNREPKPNPNPVTVIVGWKPKPTE